MTKKEYLRKLLSTIWTDIFPIAPDIISLIENDQASDAMIDSLYLLFHNAIKNTDNTLDKQKLEKWLKFLDKLKSLEEEQDITDQKDINNLDEILKNI
jgi:hypothetical protein